MTYFGVNAPKPTPFERTTARLAEPPTMAGPQPAQAHPLPQGCGQYVTAPPLETVLGAPAPIAPQIAGPVSTPMVHAPTKTGKPEIHANHVPPPHDKDPAPLIALQSVANHPNDSIAGVVMHGTNTQPHFYAAPCLGAFLSFCSTSRALRRARTDVEINAKRLGKVGAYRMTRGEILRFQDKAVEQANTVPSDLAANLEIAILMDLLKDLDRAETRRSHDALIAEIKRRLAARPSLT